MQTFSAEALGKSPFRFIGALDFDQREQGISPPRLPGWTRPQVPRMMDVMVRKPEVAAHQAGMALLGLVLPVLWSGAEDYPGPTVADAGDLPDDLHPNAAGYIRMGQRFAATVLAPLGYPS